MKLVAICKRWLAVAFVFTAFCCEKKSEPEPAEQPAKAASAKPLAVLPTQPYRFDAPERIVAVGDVHGDLDATRRVLRLAGAIDGSDNWTGGNLAVVQVGDQLDRGDQEREILELFDKLSARAKQAGGAFHPLLGNHELMNVEGDFRYVTPAGFLAFADEPTGSINEQVLRRFVEPARGRAAAFLPGGRWAKVFSNWRAIVQLGKTAFVHGGIAPEHVDYGIGRINAELAAFMRGELMQLPSFLDGPQSPLWMRTYSVQNPELSACETLGRVLKDMDAERMVVGHTVQEAGISSACDGRVWRIDVGLSAYYGERLPQALEIKNGTVRTLDPYGSQQPRPPSRSALPRAAASP